MAETHLKTAFAHELVPSLEGDLNDCPELGHFLGRVALDIGHTLPKTSAQAYPIEYRQTSK